MSADQVLAAPPSPPRARRTDAPKATSGIRPPKLPGQFKRGGWRYVIRRDWQLYTLLLLPVLYLVIFRYLPMIGNIIAFRKYQPGGNIFGEYWAGFTYFEMFINDPTFWMVFQNTIILGGLTLLFSFPVPIIFALLLNELRFKKFKNFIQSASYLPHFLSIVIVAGMMLQMVSLDGTVNQLITAFGGDPIAFMQNADWFRTIYVASDVWQTMGWGAILYLAALTTIDDTLYEAARIDGANRWQQTWHVTLPDIAPMIVTLLILNIGTFMAVGFEKILLIYNPLVYETADVISTYLYRIGLGAGNFSYATAIGMFESLIGLTLILSANFISKRLVGTSLW